MVLVMVVEPDGRSNEGEPRETIRTFLKTFPPSRLIPWNNGSEELESPSPSGPIADELYLQRDSTNCHTN